MFQEARDRITDFSAMLDQLLDARVYRLVKVCAELPTSSCVEGVYLFSLPDRPDSLVYAGRTKMKTIVGGFKDHRRLKNESDLRGMLLRMPSAPPVASEYGARWLEVSDPAKRSRFELFIIAVVAPPFNRYNVLVPAPADAAPVNVDAQAYDIPSVR